MNVRAMCRASLLRRVILAILLSFALIWLMLVGYNFYQLTNPDGQDKVVHETSSTVFDLLVGGRSSTEQVRAQLVVFETIFARDLRESRIEEPFYFFMESVSGQPVYLSPAFHGIQVRSPPGQIRMATLHGVRYRILTRQNERWRLTLGLPDLSLAWMVERTLAETWPQVMMAFFIVILTLIVAVRTGLRPLQTLSGLIARRSPDDTSALDFKTRHAELIPLVQALDGLLLKTRLRLERERAFVEDAAHELRTPIAVMAAQAHRLAREAGPEEGAALEAAVARAGALVTQLLDLARLDRTMQVRRAPVDLVPWLQHVLAMMDPLAARRDIALALEAPDALSCMTDVAMLESVVCNLVQNALHYGREGGQVVVALSRDADRIVLTVSDDGPGIAPAVRSRVFERFYRVPGSSGNGSGLGLAIVQMAVTRLGGHVVLTDGAQGTGCRFTVSLPFQEPGIGS